MMSPPAPQLGTPWQQADRSQQEGAVHIISLLRQIMEYDAAGMHCLLHLHGLLFLLYVPSAGQRSRQTALATAGISIRTKT